jgi:hypothetical protein
VVPKRVDAGVGLLMSAMGGLGSLGKGAGALGKWPFKGDGGMASLAEIMSGKCLNFAKKIQQQFGGEIMEILPKHIKMKTIGSVNDLKGNLIHEYWQNHYAVKIDNMIYDGITGSNGLPFDEYKRLFTEADRLIFRPFTR